MVINLTDSTRFIKESASSSLRLAYFYRKATRGMFYMLPKAILHTSEMYFHVELPLFTGKDMDHFLSGLEHGSNPWYGSRPTVASHEFAIGNSKYY